MTPLPAAFGGSSELVAWRLDQERHAATWDSGEGAFRLGGRWNSRGTRAVYCSIDPSTAILEVAVHNGFKALDTVPHVLTALTFSHPARVHVVDATSIPNPNWLQPGSLSAGQQAYGDALLVHHAVILLPSVVSNHSWNLIFDPGPASGTRSIRLQQRFALDTRLHPPV